jgi:hypothetical protein
MSLYYGDCEQMIAKWREFAATYHGCAKGEANPRRKHGLLRQAWRYLRLAKQLQTMLENGTATLSSVIIKPAKPIKRSNVHAPPSDEPHKHCASCGKLKPLSRFGPSRRYPLGQDRCKYCRDNKREAKTCLPGMTN